MNKIIALKIVNPILFVSGAIQIATGLAMFFRLFISNGPVFGLIADVHQYNGFLFASLIAFHLYLNWGWIKSQFWPT